MPNCDSDSSSDSDDNERMKQFLEAADTTLLSDALFQKNATTAQPDEKQVAKDSSKAPKSQRYLDEENIAYTEADINLPEAVQRHIAKKLSQIIEKNYEFCNDTTVHKSSKSHKTPKSRVKLISGADCYVKTYDEFEYDTKGPGKKPKIKRRKVDDEVPENEIERLQAAVISEQNILEGKEIKNWTIKPERKDKVFHYKRDSKGVLHAKEIVNEFTQLRRKNKWNEAKIKQKIK